MKTIYPNLFKKNKYIATLAWKYSLQYESFNSDQIRAPIQLIVDALDYEINESSEETFKALVIEKCDLIFTNTSQVNEEHLSQSFLAILYYFKGMEDIIRHFSNRKKVLFPEKNKEKYLEFTSKMTQEVVTEILDCTQTALVGRSNILSSEKESVLRTETIFRKSPDNEDKKHKRISFDNQIT